jgi:hypothetical protein
MKKKVDQLMNDWHKNENDIKWKKKKKIITFEVIYS